MVTENLFTSEQVTTSSDDHYTPKHIFERLGLEFDLDVAAPPAVSRGYPLSATTPCTTTDSLNRGAVESG